MSAGLLSDYGWMGANMEEYYEYYNLKEKYENSSLYNF